MLRFSDDALHPLESAVGRGYGNGEGSEARNDVTVSHEDDEKTRLLSQGLTLLLRARERVLTLSEQRVGHFLSQLITIYFVSLAPSPSDSSTHITLYNNLC